MKDDAQGRRGIIAALSAALLFGLGTPAAKMLLTGASPWPLAGVLYTASGLALAVYRLVTRPEPVHLERREVPALIGAVLCGGVIGPVLLMMGLRDLPASGACSPGRGRPRWVDRFRFWPSSARVWPGVSTTT